MIKSLNSVDEVIEYYQELMYAHSGKASDRCSILELAVYDAIAVRDYGSVQVEIYDDL